MFGKNIVNIPMRYTTPPAASASLSGNQLLIFSIARKIRTPTLCKSTGKWSSVYTPKWQKKFWILPGLPAKS